jgi:hypothetical protein
MRAHHFRSIISLWCRLQENDYHRFCGSGAETGAKSQYGSGSRKIVGLLAAPAVEAGLPDKNQPDQRIILTSYSEQIHSAIGYSEKGRSKKKRVP